MRNLKVRGMERQEDEMTYAEQELLAVPDGGLIVFILEITSSQVELFCRPPHVLVSPDEDGPSELYFTKASITIRVDGCAACSQRRLAARSRTYNRSDARLTSTNIVAPVIYVDLDVQAKALFGF
jgi:hypothetical protein